MTAISRHFTLGELTASATARQHGVANTPSVQEVCNLCGLVHHVLEPLRLAMGEPIKVGSGYRCAALNRMVGGATNSQHLRGEAADLCLDGDVAKGKRWFAWILQHCDFDQLIWEHNAKGTYWVHVSHRTDGPNRHQVIDNLMKR